MLLILGESNLIETYTSLFKANYSDQTPKVTPNCALVNASLSKYAKQSGLGIIGRFAYATNLAWCPIHDPWYGGIINIYLTVTSMVADLRVLQSSELCQVMTMKLEVPVGPARSYGACFIAVDTVQETTLEMPDSARALAEMWLTANTISMVFNYIWRMAIWATFKIGDVPMQAQAIAMIWQKISFPRRRSLPIVVRDCGCFEKDGHGFEVQQVVCVTDPEVRDNCCHHQRSE